MNDRYLQYELTDLLADDAFVDWSLADKSNDQWQDWLKTHPSEISKIEEAKRLTKGLTFKEDRAGHTVKNDLWSRIERSTQAKEATLKDRRTWVYGLIAAASVTLLGIIFLPGRGATTVTTSLAEVQTILLPANSVVELAESSTLNYETDDWTNRREVELSGSANFNVTKGVGFTVKTTNGQVSVLGTQFDVLSKNKSFLVKVTEGTVRTNADNYERILTAGMAFYRNPEWLKGNAAIPPEWLADRALYIFKDRPLSEVLMAFSSIHQRTFIKNEVDGKTLYTGSFDTTEDMETSLRQILWTMNIDFNIQEDTIELNARPR